FLPAAWRATIRAAGVFQATRLVERAIDKGGIGAWSSGVARTRLIDDWIADAVAAGVSQVVLLGAGFDCRALRLPPLPTIPTFEVDRPQLLQEKRKALGASIETAHPNLGWVSVDFRRDDLAMRLKANGFTNGARTLILWEGVTNYLDAETVAGVFDLVARI